MRSATVWTHLPCPTRTRGLVWIVQALFPWMLQPTYGSTTNWSFENRRKICNLLLLSKHLKSNKPLCVTAACSCNRQGAASGVRVNSVVAGHVETPIYGETPREALVAVTGTTQLIARLIQPEEVGKNP